jgi:hypothetical protein
LLGISVNVKEILPGKNLSAGVQEPQAASRGDFIKDAAVFIISELVSPGLCVAQGQAVVAMSTF